MSQNYNNSNCLRYYDAANKRLVYLDAGVGKEFWDDHWQEHNLEALAQKPPKHRWILGVTGKYVPPGGRILEGGSGLGHKVHALHKAGYDAVGVDYIDKTLAWSRETWKPATFVQGDVRELPFDDNSFDGYWSFGVIEHFYDGYESILSEMHRVLKPGGHVMCTFPAMTGIRHAKVRKEGYDQWEESEEKLEKFFQFALDPASVVGDFEKLGFDLVKNQGIGSLSGWPEENPLVKTITDNVRKLPFGLLSKFNVVMDPMIGDYFGHSVLLVMRKT
ncbi:MAG: class I SAM-dependent methyltransferase [Gammaproteobacteria bacterium]